MPNYAPGDPQKLEKAQIAACEPPNTEIEVYFNPKEITIDKPVPWQKHKNVEGDAPTLEFTAAEPKTLSCELMFDMFEERGDVYETYISQLETLALIDDTHKRPPLCTFTWGSKMPNGGGGARVFKGVVESLNVKYTLFLPDGTPCRATVTLKMKQAERLLNKQEAKEANKKKKQKQQQPTGGNVADGAASSQEARDNAAASGDVGRTGSRPV
jgi:hypothetical protein